MLVCIFASFPENDVLCGVTFPKILSFKSNVINTRTSWALATLLYRVEVFLQVIESQRSCTPDWIGSLLVCLTKYCFKQREKRQVKNDPFKLKHVSSIDIFLFISHYHVRIDFYFSCAINFCAF